MPVSYIESIYSSNQSLNDTYFLPKVSLYFLLISQLCELSVDLLVTNCGVDV